MTKAIEVTIIVVLRPTGPETQSPTRGTNKAPTGGRRTTITTATQTAAVQEPETSIIKEAQRAERKAAKMKEKAIALAEQQAYDDEAKREMQKREEADRAAYIQHLSERADRTQKEYDKLMSHLVTVLESESFAKVSDSEFVSVYQWQKEVNAEYEATQPEQAVDSAKRHVHNARHGKCCSVSRCIEEPEDVMKFYSTESTDGRIVTLTVMIDHQRLMQRARSSELSNGLHKTIIADYDNHIDSASETVNVARLLHTAGILKLESYFNGSDFSIRLNAGTGRRAMTIDVKLRDFTLNVSTVDCGLIIRPDGHSRVSVTRERSPYQYE